MAWVFLVLGLLVGSFLNVCVYRIPRQETIVFGSSHCCHCGARLGPRDLIPVFSYLFLKGKCRYCHEGISLRYPLVEILTGLLFYLTYTVIGFQPVLVKYLFFFSMLVIIAFVDIYRQIIPNRLVLVVLVWAVGWQLLWPEISGWQSVLGGVVGGGVLLLIAVISQGAMGGGDIKLMFAAGLILGFPATLLALFIAFFTGALGGAVLLTAKVKQRKDPIPFGPFLVLGTWIASLWGEQLIHWYFVFSGFNRGTFY